MAEQVAVTRRDVETRLIVQAWKDEAFAADLRRDPRGAVERELTKLGVTGATLSADIEVTVVEESPTKLCLVLPSKPANVESLSDEQLAQIAGGNQPTQIPIGTPIALVFIAS